MKSMYESQRTIPKVGDRVPYWFAPEGTEVLGVRPYTGSFPQWFHSFVKLRSDTHRGWTETVWPHPVKLNLFLTTH